MKTESYVGHKYLIEIEQEYGANQRKSSCDTVDPIKLYKVKGFNSLVFDEQGISKLKRMPELEQLARQFEEIENIKQTAYENGLHDAWEIAKKIECVSGYDGNELVEIFGTYNVEVIFAKYTASEALDKVRAYEEQKEKAVNDEIAIGDEIIVKVLRSNREEIPVIVCRIDYASTTPVYKCFSFIENAGFVISHNRFIKKTGRHFPQITSLMNKLSTP